MSKCYFCDECKCNKSVMVEIYRNDGEKIHAEDVDWIHTDEFRTIEVHLKKDSVGLNDRENELLRCLLEEAIHNGGAVYLIREYVDLLNKLEKKFE